MGGAGGDTPTSHFVTPFSTLSILIFDKSFTVISNTSCGNSQAFFFGNAGAARACPKIFFVENWLGWYTIIYKKISKVPSCINHIELTLFTINSGSFSNI